MNFNQDVLSGMVLGLAAAMVGGLVVLIWLYTQTDRAQPPEGGISIVFGDDDPPYILVDEARERLGLPPKD